jgi:hypothetical protein
MLSMVSEGGRAPDAGAFGGGKRGRGARRDTRRSLASSFVRTTLEVGYA